jgi:thioredoxin 1
MKLTSRNRMPTFLIFKGGKVIDTIKGANQSALMAAVEKAVKLAGAAPVPLYSTPGRTLGGAPSTSLSRGFSSKKFIDAIIAFLGLYFTTLLSIDAYAAAENSPFNIHRVPPEPTGLRARVAASRPAGKKLGTISDISGGD